MTSEITYLEINENFPIAGQDNDTQVFRDNFGTIKRSLNSAQSEITDLQNNTAKLNEENDFQGNVVSQAILTRNTDFLTDKGQITATTNTIDFEDGPYQIIRFGTTGGAVSLDFIQFPSDSSKVGKVTLELYGNDAAQTLSFIASGGMTFKKNSSFPATLTVTSSTDPVILEVWRHDSGYMFLNYLGQFS